MKNYDRVGVTSSGFCRVQNNSAQGAAVYGYFAYLPKKFAVWSGKKIRAVNVEPLHFVLEGLSGYAEDTGTPGDIAPCVVQDFLNFFFFKRFTPVG